MKILLVSETYKLQINGVANVVIEMANALRKQGHEVKVLSLAKSRTSFRDGDDYYIGSLPAVVYPDMRISFTKHDPLLDELKEWNPDIIHIHTEFTAYRWARKIAKDTHTPYMMTVHTDYAQFLFGRFYRFPLFVWFVRQWSKTKYLNAAVVTTPSEKLRDRAQLSSVRDSVLIVPNGIKLEQYNKPVSREEKENLIRECGLKNNGKILVLVTRVSKEKNIKELISYMPALLEKDPEIQFLIVGDGPDRKRLEAYTKKKELTEQVRFTGRIEPDQVYRYYALGDLFVAASRFEIHSMTYLEAICCGLPLVCRDDISLKGVLDHGVNGFAYETQEEYVEYVLTILHDRDLQMKMAKESLDKSLQYSDRVMMQKMLDLYDNLLEKKETADEAES